MILAVAKGPLYVDSAIRGKRSHDSPPEKNSEPVTEV